MAKIFCTSYPERRECLGTEHARGRAEEVLLERGQGNVAVPVLPAHAVVRVLCDEHGEQTNKDANAKVQPKEMELVVQPGREDDDDAENKDQDQAERKAAVLDHGQPLVLLRYGGLLNKL